MRKIPNLKKKKTFKEELEKVLKELEGVCNPIGRTTI
jgi:ribosomal protein L11